MHTAAKPARDTDTETAVVTKAELVELRDCQADYKTAAKKADKLEKQLEFLQLKLVEKVLGLKSKDELKVLPLEKVQKLFAKRQAEGFWELAERAPLFAFQQTHKGRYPAWKDLFTAEKGEAAAMKIADETPETYSYRIEVASPL